MLTQITQRQKLEDYMAQHPIARAVELRQQGVAATTISRAVQEGQLAQIARGLYQKCGSELNLHQSLVEVSKQVPKGIIAMQTALAFHGLTDQMPRKVWIAISRHDWAPDVRYPPTRIVRFTPSYFDIGIEQCSISGIDVPIYSVSKTLADLFRNSKLVDRSIAIEGLRNALKKRMSPSSIQKMAKACGAWTQMQPYLEALTSHD